MNATKLAITLALAGFALTSVVYAATIGSIGNTGSGATDTGVINWNGLYPGSASGSTTTSVTATVTPTLSLDISTGAIALGNLSTTTPATANINFSLSTNAVNGATVTVDSSTGGIYSSTANHLIGFATGSTAGTEGYQLLVASGTNGTTHSGVTSGTFSNNDTAGINSTTGAAFFSYNGPVDTATAVATVHANISAVTPAGNYAVTHTFTVTGTF